MVGGSEHEEGDVYDREQPVKRDGMLSSSSSCKAWISDFRRFTFPSRFFPLHHEQPSPELLDNQWSAASAASSLALLRLFPSYQ